MTPRKLIRRLFPRSRRVALLTQICWLRHMLLGHRPGRHALPTRLAVSLTSYPPRYATLHLTLKCLLMQSVRADEVVLWIADQDAGALPRNVTNLQAHGLTIRTCPDLGPYKKLIPQLQRDPQCAVATADDDIHYPPQWLEQLVGDVHLERREILCHRAHKIAYNARSGCVAPYANWSFDAKDVTASRLLFPTGAGGILYMPGVLHPEVGNIREFQRNCPTNDDIWFFFMGVRGGCTFRKVDGKLPHVSWDGSQQSALWDVNRLRNDAMIAAMIAQYGDPWAVIPEPIGAP